MTTIDKLDVDVYNSYAKRTALLEQIYQEFQLQEASSIPPQTEVLNILPKIDELDLLLGIAAYHTPWAHFLPPKKFFQIRRSPFTTTSIAPSLGQEEILGSLKKLLEETKTTSADEEREKNLLLSCLKEVKHLNEILSYILGRMGQFIQG